jgi:ribosome-binding factor A
MDETRRSRIASRILREVSELHTRGEIKDHRIDPLISFSYVKIAKDGSVARIGVSAMDDKPHRLARAVEGLNSAAGYIQGRLGSVLRLRSTPRVYFVEDHSVAEAQDVIRKIDAVIGDDLGNSDTEQTPRS